MKHTPDFLTLKKRIADVLLIPTAYFYTENDRLAEIIRIIVALGLKNNLMFTDLYYVNILKKQPWFIVKIL